jgi:uncharacterized protein
VAASLALALIVAGCHKDKELPPGPVVPANSGLPTQAQPKLQTLKIWLGPEEMVAELALTSRQQQTGMMFRTNMAENEGMLFPLPYTQRAAFWMMNCPLSLSAAYIDPSGVIQEIHTLEANNTNPVPAAAENIRFVLETREGWFARHGINVGTSIRTERGTLMETFFSR